MNWFGNLAETYEHLLDVVGIPDEKGNILLPLNHMIANTDVCITIDGDGYFRRADESKHSIIIPCTEDSSSRSGSSVFPHPLHEQLGYLALDEAKRNAYLSKLTAWSRWHPKVEAVRNYIENNTIITDLLASDLKADNPKLFIRFSVEIIDDKIPHLWEDPSIAEAWNKYSADSQSGNTELCYVTGKERPIRTKHPKGVNPSKNGAKLISCNDEINYTYKGRFTRAEQANAISAEASHRAHSMLKYLISVQGYKCDSQAVVAWSVNDGKPAPSPLESTRGLVIGLNSGHEDKTTNLSANELSTDDLDVSEHEIVDKPVNAFGDSLDFFEDDNAVQTSSDKLISAYGTIDYAYARKLRSALSGRGNAKELNLKNRHIAVIAVDAATEGRMSVIFYRDMPENEYTDRIIAWHESCCWWFRTNSIDYVSAPHTDRIITAVYGEPKGENYNKIKKQARERLLRCIVDGEQINRGWINAAVNRSSNPFSFSKTDGGWNKSSWENAVSVTCAIMRKYLLGKKEEYSLELDKTLTDRDYLYGRLLAYADRIENYSRFLQVGGNDTEKRPTNAVRYMTAFASKPFRTWHQIYSRELNPYMQRLAKQNKWEWYQQQIDEILSLFKEGEFDNDKSLDGKYLLGYSLQRRALLIRKKEEESENAEQEN